MGVRDFFLLSVKIQPARFFGTVIIGEADADDAIATRARSVALRRSRSIDAPRSREATSPREELKAGAHRGAVPGRSRERRERPAAEFSRAMARMNRPRVGSKRNELETGRGLRKCSSEIQQPQHGPRPGRAGAFEFGQHASRGRAG